LLRAHDGGAAVLLLIGDARPESCAGAAVIIATEPLRGRCRATSTAPYVDRFTVWRTGAQAIWLNADGHATILADHTVRGDRPWVPDPRLRAD
jgi:competence protein ComEC